MKKKAKLQDRYVLGEGYPWALGTAPYASIALCEERIGVRFVGLSFPDDLWQANVPKYRLVLERIKK